MTESDCGNIAEVLYAGLHIIKNDTSPESVVAALRPLVAVGLRMVNQISPGVITWNEMFLILQGLPSKESLEKQLFIHS